MKKLWIAGTSGLLGLAMVLLATAPVGAQQAQLFNHADGASCAFATFGGFYVGPATIVQTNSGNVNAQCDASLVAG